jgi:hypothetical protein
VRNDIVEMYKAKGKQPPKDMQETVYYNRGLLNAVSDVSYFNRLFRSRFEETPSDVRAAAHRHLGDHPPIA